MWVHAFVHTLDEIPHQWYVSVESHKEITTWEELSMCFSHTFSFEDVDPTIHSALQHICNVFMKVLPFTYPVDLHQTDIMQSMMECYNATGGPDDGDDPWNFNIPEIEGIKNVTTPKISTDQMNQTLKIRKVNIGTKEQQNFANVGDY